MRDPVLYLNRRTSADIQSQGAQIDRVSHRRHAPNPQVRKVHLIFQAGHRRFDACAPAIDIPKCIAAFVKSPFLVFGPCWRVLKAGELSVLLVGPYWAEVPVRAFPAYHKIETRL